MNEAKNYMEDIVWKELDQVIDKLECCKCKQCREDIAAYALNHLAPKYYTSAKGAVFLKADHFSVQDEVQVLNAIFQGAKIVSEHPRHEVNE